MPLPKENPASCEDRGVLKADRGWKVGTTCVRNPNSPDGDWFRTPTSASSLHLGYDAGMMARALVFGCLGPVLSGWLLLIANTLHDRGGTVIVIPYMALEVILLSVGGLADFLLDGIRGWARVLALAAACALTSGVAMFFLTPRAFQDLGVVFALGGALPAAICSLVAGRMRRSQPAPSSQR